MTTAWRTVAEMQARDLLRRRTAVLLLAVFPMIWYGAEAAAGISYAVGTGILAIAWAAAAAALFAFVAARHVDLRPNLFIPYYGPLRLTDYDQPTIGPAGPALHTLVWAAVIGVVALVLWRRHQALASSGDATTRRTYCHSDDGASRP